MSAIDDHHLHCTDAAEVESDIHLLAAYQKVGQILQKNCDYHTLDEMGSQSQGSISVLILSSNSCYMVHVSTNGQI